jgi:hypothetical protein
VNGKPRYSLIVRDSGNPLVLNHGTMACLVVPLGGERELNIFDDGTQEKLLEQTAMARLVIVILGKGHKYESLDLIKEELNSQIIALIPENCQNADSIPYMSTGKTIHLRETVFEDEQIIVEDYVHEDEEKG